MSEFHQYSPNVRNSITYSLEKGSLTNYNIDISKIVFTGLIFLYIFFYPPFRSSGIAALIPIRLTIETLVLIFLLIKTQMVRPGKLQVNLLWAVLCILIFGVFSPEAIRNVLSFFNKILFFLLLIKILEFDNITFNEK